MRSIFPAAALALCALLGAGESVPTSAPPPLIYVPYDKVPGLDPAKNGVMLPYEAFRRLWEAANRQAPPQDKPVPPVAAALSGFELAGAVEGERAVLHLAATAVALAEGWSTLDLPGGLAVAELKAADPRVVLERTGEALRLHLPAPGTYALTGELAAPVVREAAGGRALELVLPGSGSGRLDLLLPEAGAELAVSPALAVATQPEAAGTRVRAVVGGQRSVRLSWRVPVVAAAGEALLMSDSRMTVRIGDRSLTTEARISATVMRRGVAEFAIRLPEGAQVLAVQTTGLRTWEVADGILRLRLHEATEGVQAIDLRLERLLPAAAGASRELAVALPELVGAERRTGTLVLRADEGLALAVSGREGLSQIDPAEADAAGAAAAFRFLAQPPPLMVAATRLEPDVRAVLHQLVRLGADETRIDVVAELNVRRAGVFALAAALPDGWELVDAGGLAIDDTRISGGSPQRRLELALRARLIGDGRLNLRFRAPAALPRQGGRADLGVGLFAIDGVRLGRGSLLVAAPRSWSLGVAAAEGLAGADARNAAADPLLAEAIRALRDDEEVALAWTWLGQGRGPTLAAAPRNRELTVHHEELATVAEGSLRRLSTFRGEVRYAAAPALRLRLPAPLAAAAQVRAAGLAEKVVAPAAADGTAEVELRFQTPLLGAFSVQVETIENLPRLEAGKPLSLSLAPITMAEGTRRSALLAVARDGSLTVAASAPGLDAIATADLPPGLAGPGVVAGFRGAEAVPATLTVERHDLLALTDAALPLVAYSAVLGEDGRLRAAGRALVVSRGRPHLELRLPEGAEILEVALDGRQTRPSRRADGALVVPLGERSAAAGSHHLAFVYEQPVAPGPLGAGMLLGLRLPVLGAAAEGRAVPVERTLLTLWLPQRFAVLGGGGDLLPAEDGVARPLGLPEHDDGLTVDIPEVGRAIALARLGDGGEVRLRLLAHGWVQALAALAGLGVAVLGWWLRRRPRPATALAAAAVAAAVVAGGAAPAWSPFALAGGAGAAVVLLMAIASALRRRRAAAAAAPAADPWTVERP